MDFVKLHYFITICKYMHFTKAAAELHISQPALSISMSRLEKELGVELFKKQGRCCILTPQGELIYRHAYDIWTSYCNMKVIIEDSQQLSKLTIKLGCSSHRSILEFFKDFIKNHQDVLIQQESLPFLKLKEKLLNNELDLCISSPPISGLGIECHSLCLEEILLQVPRTHKFATMSNIRLIDCAAEKFMGFPEHYSFREQCDKLFKNAGFTPNYVIKMDTASLLDFRKTSFAGQFFGLFPRSLCNSTYNADGNSVFVKVLEPKCYRVLSLSWLKQKKNMAVYLPLINYLKDYYQTSYIKSDH